MKNTSSVRSLAPSMLAAFGVALLAAGVVAAENRAVEAGPLWSNTHANAACPGVCVRAGGTWTRQWWTTVQGRMSVCECAFPAPVAPAAPVELLVNGGFEQPAIAAGSFQYVAEMPGWRRSVGDAVEVQNRVAGAPGEGSQFVELDAAAPSAIYQDVAVTAGATYELSFLYSPRPGVTAQNNTIEVWIDGARLTTLSASGEGQGDTRWARISLPVRASRSTLRVEFRDAGLADSYGGYLDGVSLMAARAPEPATRAVVAR